MTDIETLRALQKRVRDCTKADRELDCAIACVLLGGTPDIAAPAINAEYQRRRAGDSYFDVPKYTTDPDGLGYCVALMHARLPGAKRNVACRSDEEVWVHIIQGDFYVGEIGKHRIENHATLLAIISVEISKLEVEQEKERVG